jgi:hypothetical protein
MFRPVGRSLRRSLAAWRTGTPVAVLDWGAWDKFLIQRLCPAALRIDVRPGDRAHDLARCMPKQVGVAFLHVDVSTVAPLLPDSDVLHDLLAARGIPLLNGRATDIRKDTIHRRASEHGLPTAHASREGAPDERLIVKTVLNVAGEPERRLLAQMRDSDTPTAQQLRQSVSTTLTDALGYRVCLRSDIPAEVWDDPTLVVERFIGNRDGVYYRVYSLGQAASVVEAWTNYEIKKLLRPVHRRLDHFFWFDGDESPSRVGATLNGVPCREAVSEQAARAAVAARALARVLGVDFHATDCVMDDNGAITPIDVNKTPYWGDDIRPGVLEHLGSGLDALLASR